MDAADFRCIADRLRSRSPGQRAAVLATLQRDGTLTREQAKDILFAPVTGGIGIEARWQ